MKVEVFESCCCKSNNLDELVSRTVGETGVSAEIARFTDQMEAIKRGIMRLPAIIIDGKVVCSGRTPKPEEIAGWLTGGKA